MLRKTVAVFSAAAILGVSAQTARFSNPLFVDLESEMYEAPDDNHAWPYRPDGKEHAKGPMFTADPSAHVWQDGRLYVYASHDLQPSWGCDRMDRYHVFSTDDMVNWVDHGEILNSLDVYEQAGWGIPGWMWAPDCAYNPADRLYYFFFPHPAQAYPWGGHEWRIGVATSPYPDRDFKVIGYVKGAASYIDPCVFVDDDGQAYFYQGGGATCMAGKLKSDDWTQIDGEVQRMEGLEDFHEGAWVHKYNGKYYLSHPDNHPDKDGNYMRYSVSDSPLGPWTPMGVLMYPTGSGTNHGSIVEYKGKWYFFYHTANFSGDDSLRSVCVDELQINPDGSLQLCRNWGEPRDGRLPRLGSAGLLIDGSRHNLGGEHYAYHKATPVPAPDAKSSGNASPASSTSFADCAAEEQPLMPLAKGEWARYSFEAVDDCVCDVYVTAEGDGRYHLSLCGHSLLGRDSTTGVHIFRGVRIPKGENYFDFRIDDGRSTLTSIAILPTRN